MCEPLVAYLFLYLYEVDFVHIYLTFHYTYKVLSWNNLEFNSFINVRYPVELEIKDTRILHMLLKWVAVLCLMMMVDLTH